MGCGKPTLDVNQDERYAGKRIYNQYQGVQFDKQTFKYGPTDNLASIIQYAGGPKEFRNNAKNDKPTGKSLQDFSQNVQAIQRRPQSGRSFLDTIQGKNKYERKRNNSFLGQIEDHTRAKECYKARDMKSNVIFGDQYSVHNSVHFRRSSQI